MSLAQSIAVGPQQRLVIDLVCAFIQTRHLLPLCCLTVVVSLLLWVFNLLFS